MHCSILGTCLSVAELRVIGRKAAFSVAPDRSDYEVHGLFTAAARKKSVIAKFMHKALDAKFATVIRRFCAARTEEDLENLWAQAWSNRDVPGAYWAVVTHPATNTHLVESAFGEVHMLSHLSGASQLVAARELDDLAERVADLKNEQALLRQRLAERDKALSGFHHLKHDLSARDRENDRLRQRLAEYEAGTMVESLRASVRQLSDQAEARARRIRKLESDLRAERAFAAEMRRQRPLGNEACFDGERIRPRRAIGCPNGTEADGSESEPAEPPDLLGKRVLYVGGRPGTVVHLRSLIEQHNGAFLYHDGGKEERDARLNDVLTQADLVVCPTDCVSHAACLRAKSFCKMAKKPFIILRTASRSSLANRLTEISKHVA